MDITICRRLFLHDKPHRDHRTSISRWYQAFSIRGYEYVRTDFVEGKVYFHIKVPPMMVKCPGGGPHVCFFDGLTGTQLPGPIGSFFAFVPGFRGGVYVATGDVNGDTFDDVIIGADTTGGPHVKVLSGRDGSQLASFFAYDAGFTGRMFLAGNPFGNPGAPLRVAGGATISQGISPLDETQLDLLVAAALAIWQTAGYEDATLSRLSQVEIEIMDLAGDLLGLTYHDRVLIDLDAAGHGWHVDPFSSDVPANRVDLPTVLLHELGHVLGLDDLAPNLDELMSAELPPGHRHRPTYLRLSGRVEGGPLTVKLN